MKTSIKIENLSKQYRLGVVGTGTLSHDLKRWWVINVRGKEDPYLKIGETNDRATKGNSDYVWALKDINIDIKEGDVVGIIGKNGAGKSTLLKILSRVTKPTTGSIQYNGRIASLLEVGTGFHPEMTGRENIYMNGAIMGMTRSEITSKLDEIIAFAGVERYIDTPVKRYSSGMTVRLGFSIAAHLEPDILVVDEVLAVGDAEFQKKAIGKMQDVSKGNGRTVLFVSHNMAAVKSLCTKGILLGNGQVISTGSINEIIEDYMLVSEKNNTNQDKIRNDAVDILEAKVFDLNSNYIKISSQVVIECSFLNKTANTNLAITFEICTAEGIIVIHHGTWLCQDNNSEERQYDVRAILPEHLLNQGNYYLNIIIASSLHNVLIHVENIFSFKVENESLANHNLNFPGIIRPNVKYIIK